MYVLEGAEVRVGETITTRGNQPLFILISYSRDVNSHPGNLATPCFDVHVPECGKRTPERVRRVGL